MALDKLNIRAIYQKAEALYFMGQFESSLVFFHRGLFLRAELACFRLGVQKAQEAIQKTIGEFKNGSANSMLKRMEATPKQSAPSEHRQSIARSSVSGQNRLRRTGTQSTPDSRQESKLLGQLCVDKEYLENLLKHPNLKRRDNGTENISAIAEESIRFLNTQQEFWRQQRPCTALTKKKHE